MKLFLIPFLIALCCAGFAQNLVPNNSFEEYPYELIRKDGLLTIYLNQTSWKSFGSIDLFARANETTPCNSFGSICPQNGNAFSGLNCLYPKEVAQIKLKQLLEKDKRYCISFYKGKSINSDSVIGPDILFSDTLIHNFSKHTFPSKKIILSPCSAMPGGWQKMYIVYQAKGNEQFISIGNFDNENEIPKNKLPKWHHSYSFIDNVEVKEVKDIQECGCYTDLQNEIELSTAKCKCELNANTLQTEKSMNAIVAAITFDVGKSELHPSSFSELNKLAALMESNPDIKIEIKGHTDNEGTEPFNQTLSLDRARVVMNYLVVKKINPSRISFIGFGSSRPLASNITEEGRAMNRRVEILVK